MGTAWTTVSAEDLAQHLDEADSLCCIYAWTSFPSFQTFAFLPLENLLEIQKQSLSFLRNSPCCEPAHWAHGGCQTQTRSWACLGPRLVLQRIILVQLLTHPSLLHSSHIGSKETELLWKRGLTLACILKNHLQTHSQVRSSVTCLSLRSPCLHRSGGQTLRCWLRLHTPSSRNISAYPN